jgi:hypothetical protein
VSNALPGATARGGTERINREKRENLAAPMLSRQARDKHRESTHLEDRFVQELANRRWSSSRARLPRPRCTERSATWARRQVRAVAVRAR